MKKIFIALLVALASTAGAWAEDEPTNIGTGCGTMDDPYSGSWSFTELVKVLKQGDYISQDCHMHQHDGWDSDITSITIVDDKICGYNDYIVSGWQDWHVADFIDDTPYDKYQEYVSLNSDRSDDLFVVSFIRVNKKRLWLTGHYTGSYRESDDLERDYYLELYSMINKAPKEYDVTGHEDLFISRRLEELHKAKDNDQRYAVLEKVAGEMRTFLWEEFGKEIDNAGRDMDNAYFTKLYAGYKNDLQKAKDNQDLDDMARIVAIGRHVLLSAADCYKKGYEEGQNKQYVAPEEPGKRLRVKTSNGMIFDFNLKDIESVNYYRATN